MIRTSAELSRQRGARLQRPRRWGVAALVALAFSCASANPRFSQEVATSFARDEMAKLETSNAEIYYPTAYREAALRIGERLEECLVALRRKVVSKRDRGKALIFLTSANFNNAYVSPRMLGSPLHTVLPVRMTNEYFHTLNLGAADIGDVGCHEFVHYVQSEQEDGIWGALNLAFGGVMPMQTFTESWFLEGIAQYYEGRMGHEVGRPHSPVYRASFESVLAQKGGELEGGDLNPLNRELLPFSGAYLSGLFFVQFLADRFGEGKLWQFVDEQARAIAPPFAVTLRFRRAFGMTIGSALELYRDQLVKSSRLRPRPPGQRVLVDDAGYMARLAATPSDGAVAVVSAGLDQEVKLAVYERDGRLRFERSLTQLLPGRSWVGAHPIQMSGMSFTADGRWLFLMNEDLTSVGEESAQVWKVDAHGGDVVDVWHEVGGAGGSIRPDGSRYLFVDVGSKSSRLVELELATGARSVLAELPPGTSVGSPTWSPDGRRIVFSRFGPRGFDLSLWEDGRVRSLTDDGRSNYGARWLDAQRVVFVRESDGRPQVHVLDVASGQPGHVSQAPFGALDVAANGPSGVVFLNRVGSGWSVDSVEVGRPVRASAPAVPRAPAPPPSTGPDPTDEWAPPPASALSPPLPPPPEYESAVAETADAPKPFRVLKDEPYSSLDHLFIPSLRAPVLLVSPGQTENDPWAQLYGLSLYGADRLARHSWAINAQYEAPGDRVNASIAYLNQQLAPWAIGASVARQQTAQALDYVGALQVSRDVFTTPIYLQGVVLDEVATGTRAHLRVAGGSLGLSYLAGASTPYGGTRKALGLSVDAGAYRDLLAGAYTLGDLQGELTVAPPLPLLRRHSLVLKAKGRYLPGAPAQLLQLGGIPNGVALLSREPSSGSPTPSLQLPFTFAEPLRGFEDYSARATLVGIGSGRYRYPFIIDKGWTSLLFILPSFFIRQVDLEAFGTWAQTDNPSVPSLRAAGGAVFLRTAFMGSLPMSLYAQAALRFDQGLPPLILGGLAFE